VKTIFFIITLLLLTACVDRKSEPEKPISRYDELMLDESKISSYLLKKEYKNYLDERYALETKYRKLLTQDSSTQLSAETPFNVTRELSEFGNTTTPELMRALKEIENFIKINENYIFKLSGQLVELGRDPDADPDIIKKKQSILEFRVYSRKLHSSLEDLFLMHIKLELQPSKKQEEELKSKMKTATMIIEDLQGSLKQEID
jgi:hypothetical protein